MGCPKCNAQWWCSCGTFTYINCDDEAIQMYREQIYQLEQKLEKCQDIAMALGIEHNDVIKKLELAIECIDRHVNCCGLGFQDEELLAKLTDNTGTNATKGE